MRTVGWLLEGLYVLYEFAANVLIHYIRNSYLFLIILIQASHMGWILM